LHDSCNSVSAEVVAEEEVEEEATEDVEIPLQFLSSK